MSHTLRAPLSILGRFCLVAIFLLSALGNKIPRFAEVSQTMAQVGVPFPSFMLVGAIIFLIAGGLMVLLGWKGHIGAALLLVFLVLATCFFHAFWNAPPDQRPGEMIQFMKNLGLMGAMLFLIANGTGAGSLDLGRRPSSPDTSAPAAATPL
jgi:putative oxidoreductase